MKTGCYGYIIVMSICLLGMTGVVDTQQENVIVPNVEGITLEIAAQVIQTAGLQPRFQSDSSTSAVVVRQEPRPGFSLSLGSAVILSTEATTTTTPAVIDPRALQPSQQPVQVLVYPYRQEEQSVILYQSPRVPISRHFIERKQSRSYPAWYPKRFISQDNSSGMVIQAQSPAQETVPVPNLLRLRRENAIVVIQKAGLTVGSVSYVQSANEKAGLVVKQAPQAQELVSSGTQVHLWIAAN